MPWTNSSIKCWLSCRGLQQDGGAGLLSKDCRYSDACWNKFCQLCFQGGQLRCLHWKRFRNAPMLRENAESDWKLRRCLVKYEMQYIRAWEIEEKRRQREIADLEAMRARFQKDWYAVGSPNVGSCDMCFLWDVEWMIGNRTRRKATNITNLQLAGAGLQSFSI